MVSEVDAVAVLLWANYISINSSSVAAFPLPSKSKKTAA
jgi:hypothetical protein